MDETIETTEIEPRSIDELADLPYSEMTEAEIDLMVEFRASCIARDEAHTKAMEAIHAHSREMAAIAREKADAAKSALDEMVEQSRKLFEEASASNG